ALDEGRKDNVEGQAAILNGPNLVAFVNQNTIRQEIQPLRPRVHHTDGGIGADVSGRLEFHRYAVSLDGVLGTCVVLRIGICLTAANPPESSQSPELLYPL